MTEPFHRDLIPKDMYLSESTYQRVNRALKDKGQRVRLNDQPPKPLGAFVLVDSEDRIVRTDVRLDDLAKELRLK